MRRLALTVTITSTIALAACSPSETSIVLTFPSAAARLATKEVAVYAFPQEENAATSTCREFMAHLPKGESLGANPVDDPFPLSGERRITNFPAGAPVVLVVGYNDTEAEPIQKPILQGCSDTYGNDAGYSEVPVALQVVIPAKASLNKLAGDHEVGRPGELLPVPLKLLVDAAFSVATQRDRYPLPAVPIHFEVMGGGGVSLNGAAPDAALDIASDENGLIIVPVMMPANPGTFVIKASSPDIQSACEAALPSKENKAACKAPSERFFTVSTVDAQPTLVRSTLVQAPVALHNVIGVAVGDVVGDSKSDAVILGCTQTGSPVDATACTNDAGCRTGICQIDIGSMPKTGHCVYSGCTPGRQAKGSLGRTVLTVLSDVIGSASSIMPPMGLDLGVVPGGLFVGPLIPDGKDEIAFVNSRRVACQARKCEGSEVLVLSGDQAGIKLETRKSLTASNAVALTAVRRDVAGVYGPLLTAGQGRSTLGRACSRASMCLFDTRHECPSAQLTQKQCNEVCSSMTARTRVGFCLDPDMDGVFTCPTRGLNVLECSKACTLAGPAPTFCADQCPDSPEDCGCPPNERCECTEADGCPNISQPGTCVAQDKFVDRLANGWAEERPPVGCDVASPLGCFENKNGCHDPQLYCTKGGEAVVSECACGDRPGNSCQAVDGCGCKVPVQISIGDQAGVVAHDIAVGKLTNVPGADLLAASDGGLDFLPRQAETFKWTIRKTPTRVVDFVRTLKLDRDNVEDIAWLSKAACEQYANGSEPCPLMRELSPTGMIDEQLPRGCLGLYVRKVDNKVDTVTDDGCRRFMLPFEPAGVCVGDVNGDTFSDLAVSSFDHASVFLFLGDGSGGMLDPPLEMPLAGGGKGGVVACADVDGDDVTDVVVVGKDGVVSVVRSGS